MSMPYYVSPEQMMQDRADYARKGIARGRSLIAVQYDQGIVLVAENPSSMNATAAIWLGAMLPKGKSPGTTTIAPRTTTIDAAT